MNTPTVGSMPGIELLSPSPRIEKLATPRVVPMSSIATFGTENDRSSSVRTLSASICAPENAVTAIGTSWPSSSRFLAETTISSTRIADPLACRSSSCAATGAAAAIMARINVPETIACCSDRPGNAPLGECVFVFIVLPPKVITTGGPSVAPAGRVVTLRANMRNNIPHCETVEVPRDILMATPDRIPRDRDNDYTRARAAERAAFVTANTGAATDTISSYTIDPDVTRGNIENFIGTAQVPLGLAGPLHIRGEHARGHFYVPLATTEGTLVASYSRGMRVITECGGVKTTVVSHSIQRAPAFLFADALEARDFGLWLDERFDDIRSAAEATTRTGKLVRIERYPVGNLMHTRFCYTTGDAAGQNMTGKATYFACEWIHNNHPARPKYFLSGAMDTDKKHSAVNTICTRGKRVIAEFTLKPDVARKILRIDLETLMDYRQIAMTGVLHSGAVYSGAHSANGIAALFIATGQDAADVTESHAGITYAQLLENGDFYWSVTLPALICGTYGGGTALPTQRECLEILGCYGAGHGDKFAEIVTAVVLAGDVSLTAAVISGEWVSSHESLGRNR